MVPAFFSLLSLFPHVSLHQVRSKHPKVRILSTALTVCFHSCVFKNDCSYRAWGCVWALKTPTLLQMCSSSSSLCAGGSAEPQICGCQGSWWGRGTWCLSVALDFLLSFSTLLPRIKGWRVFFSFKSKLISETNRKNDVSWKTRHWHLLDWPS